MFSLNIPIEFFGISSQSEGLVLLSSVPRGRQFAVASISKNDLQC